MAADDPDEKAPHWKPKPAPRNKNPKRKANRINPWANLGEYRTATMAELDDCLSELGPGFELSAGDKQQLLALINDVVLNVGDIARRTREAPPLSEIKELMHAVESADPIEERPGFTELLDCIDDNGVRTVLVEDQSRFARDMEAHVLGLALLRERAVRLITSNGTDLTDETDEMTEAMIHIAAVFSALEKKRLVKKLRGARARKRAEQGKCEGRKSHLEKHPGAVALAKKLHRASPKTGKRMSLRKISAALADAGHLNEHGRPFHSESVKRMVEGPRARAPALGSP